MYFQPTARPTVKETIKPRKLKRDNKEDYVPGEIDWRRRNVFHGATLPHAKSLSICNFTRNMTPAKTEKKPVIILW